MTDPVKPRWRKIEAPRVWRPQKAGEELVGTYLSTQTLEGRFGSYTARFIKDERTGDVLRVSGVRLDQLFLSVPIGARVRILFLGGDSFANDDGEVKERKEYDLFVEVQETE